MEIKTIKNLIIFGLIIFSFALVNSVSAYYSPYDSSYWLVSSSERTYQPQYDYYQQSGYDSSSYSSTEPKNYVVNNYYYQTDPTTSTVSKSTSTTKNVITNNSDEAVTDRNTTDYSNENNYNNGLGASAYNGSNQSNGNKITALSLKGSGSFMPSSIWQWILVVILILAIIIISRMFIRKPSPADHDVHVPHAH